ncbi:MAG TPA: phosphoserine aminotransferase, partial [Rhodospirillaceae bacterium]|nr:phosphoserine aminotransferase [Rhodospirillaceae bacterium]
MEKPSQKPKNPCFSSGPCAKRPGWSPENLGRDTLGRSHRAKVGKSRLKEAID